MADVKAVDERAELPEKRKLDLTIPVEKPTDEGKEEPDSVKKPKLDVPAEKNGSVSPTAGENVAEPNDNSGDIPAAEEDDDDDEDDYTTEDGDEETEIKGKGKAVVIDHKGKGKMIEESEDEEDDSDDDDSSDDSDSGFSDGLDGSDLEDDPLAEVDLDNILPSRTRRGQAPAGFRISGDSDKAIRKWKARKVNGLEYND